jgi:hypothetical protein
VYDPRWRPSWDASADHDWEARGGNVRVDTDASKIVDVPLAELASRAEENTSFGRWISSGRAAPQNGRPRALVEITPHHFIHHHHHSPPWQPAPQHQAAPSPCRSAIINMTSCMRRNSSVV